MNNKKLKVILGTGLLLVLLLLGLYTSQDSKYSPNEGLSYDEKKRDVEYLMYFLENTYPYFEEIKDDTGQNLLNERKNIITSISKTSSDVEFFAKISDFLRRFTYGTVMIDMNLNENSNHYIHIDKDLGITRETYMDKLNEGKSKWGPIDEEYRDVLLNLGYSYSANLNAIYLDGEYYISMSQNPDVHVGDKVLNVDDLPVDEYAKKVPRDKYFTTYDYNYEKYAVNSLFRSTDKIPKEITIKNSTGDEKKVNILPFDSNKPILENGFKAYENDNITEMKSEDNGNFLNFFEDGKILALNFSAAKDAQNHWKSVEEIQNTFSNILQSDYLILDLRGENNELILNGILELVSPLITSYSDYKVIKKTEINDEFVKNYKGHTPPKVTEVITPIQSLEKLYPLSKYHIFQERRVKLMGLNKYKGKVFILFDNNFSTVYTNELLKTVIDNNYATIISNGKFTLSDYIPTRLITSTLLPNSNLPITVQNGKLVDVNGTILRKIVITPQVIIKANASKAIDSLKRGEGYLLKIPAAQRYTNEDEYYNEVLKLIR